MDKATPSRDEGLSTIRSKLRPNAEPPPTLNAAERARYLTEGYAILRHALATHEVFALRGAFDELEETARSFVQDEFVGVTFFALHRRANPFARTIEAEQPVPGVLRRVTYPYALNQTLEEFRRHPRILAAVRDLIGGDLVQLVNQANFNPPQGGAGWGWHQDYRFRKPGLEQPALNFVQTLVALDPCTLFTGGLRIVPRSHDLGPLALDKENEDAETHFDPSTAITPDLAPGDVIFFSPYLIHGSTPNLSNGARRVYINGYARAGVPFGIPVMAGGEIVPGRQGLMEYEGDQAIIPKASKY